MKETIGVTGASGHLGFKLCQTLVDKGYLVKGLFFQTLPPQDIERAVWVQGDILKADVVRDFVLGCDYIIHCAARISIAGDEDGLVWKTNVTGVQNVVNACLEHRVQRLIHVSSTHAVQEAPASHPFKESRPYKELNDFTYDHSKAVGEQLVLKHVAENQLDAVVVRPSGILGAPDYRPSLLGKAIIDLYKGKIPVLPQGGYNYVDIGSVVNSIVSCIKNGVNGEVYLVTGQYYTMKEFAKVLGDVTGKRMPTVVLPTWFLIGILPLVKLWSLIAKQPSSFTYESILTLKNGHTDIRCDKAVRTLGHEPQPLSDTMGKLVKWFQKEKFI
jgi:dihydroflavonol-4-reductase